MKSDNLFLYTRDSSEIVINDREALRYMSCATKAVPKEISSDFENLKNEVLAALNLRAVISKSELSFLFDDTLKLSFGEVKSQGLFKNLSGCKEAFVFCATAGIGLDRLIKRTTIGSKARGLICDAISSAAIEGFCNRLNDDLKEKFDLRPRFSPGYGDLDIKIQPEILDFLDAKRLLGVTLSDSFLMTPTKSVTAIIGVI